MGNMGIVSRNFPTLLLHFYLSNIFLNTPEADQVESIILLGYETTFQDAIDWGKGGC